MKVEVKAKKPLIENRPPSYGCSSQESEATTKSSKSKVD